jgi:general transcription factor 3C polypeptide 3 (transcription factor C subunit 4)
MLPDDSVVNLCIAVAYLMHACSRSVGDRHACVLKAFAFFCRYVRLASCRQEAAYNMARALQHLELNSMACEWYVRALVLGRGAEPGDSLSFEAGHNLALIYESSGSVAPAARVRLLYCSV